MTFVPKRLPLALLTAFALSAPTEAGGERCRTASISAHVGVCVSGSAQSLADAIATLRSSGQAGLDALCAEHDRLRTEGRRPDEMSQLRIAIDAVARQRDAHASRLYWHTDFEEAKSRAAASGKPILSLRLLGNLDEDLSCANSRFFRSVLYANTHVSECLREHFVLHWESLRPVPRLTIDFGDGRRIERTITGNSIHYVLDHQGRIIDALPGLYAPAAFVDHLQRAETILRQSRMMMGPAAGVELLRTWHAAAVVRIDHQLQDDLRRIANNEPARHRINALVGDRGIDALDVPDAQPLAIPAAALAVSKMRAEVKAVEAAIDAPGAIAEAYADRREAMWEDLATLHAPEEMFDERSIALMRSKMPTDDAHAAQHVTPSKRKVESPALRVLREFQRSVTIDSVRNEYELHRTIHQWLAEQRAPEAPAVDIKTFNERVYAELFLTPLDDPWMGLAPRDAYAALDQGGLIDSHP